MLFTKTFLMPSALNIKILCYNTCPLLACQGNPLFIFNTSTKNCLYRKYFYFCAIFLV